MKKYQLKMPHWPKQHVGELRGNPALRTKELLAKLGSPEKKLPPVIHVGGTKGKGSTVAFLRYILENAGYKVHCYTSPHLKSFNERIVLAGEEIEDNILFEILEKTRIASDEMPLAFFDATTAAAILAFATFPADILLMEVGLGGAIDATNVIENPILTIITTISFDHTEYMGNSLTEIANFEAGILKPNVPAIISYQHQEAFEAINKKATEINSPLYSFGKNWLVRKSKSGMIFQDSYGEVELPLPSLHGAHQIVNSGNAIAAISALENFDISQTNIISGIMQTKWRGRLEQVRCPFLPKESELWFDGGHNAAASEVISHHVMEYWSDKPIYLIFGTTKGKEIAPMLEPFVEIAKHIYVVSVKSEPRSYKGEEIKQQAESLTEVTVSEDITDALKDIIKNSALPFRALIFGSLYLWLEAHNL
ncbi:MAG: folylpolyglutamate synthase/dihydrofolate synthase family protein [Pseudomonadota bacterium]